MKAPWSGQTWYGAGGLIFASRLILAMPPGVHALIEGDPMGWVGVAIGAVLVTVGLTFSPLGSLIDRRAFADD